MAASRVLILCVSIWATTLASRAKDFTVTCTESEQCVLPCQFQSDGKGARIMWYINGAIVSCTRYGDTSFVTGSNSQVDSYKGRTDLFADQVLEGNAALILKNITPHDQHKYFCMTMMDKRTDQSGVVSLVIRAPVRRVDMSFSDGRVSCSSKGIYPRPSLAWSMDAPPETERLKNWTTVNETQQGFYDIESSLQLKETDLTNRTFICRVATDTSRKTAFLKTQASVLACPGTSVTIPCCLPNNSTSYNVTWSFGQRDQILSIRVVEKKPLVNVLSQWKPHISENVQSLALKLVQVKRELQGTFICEINTAEETHITYTELIVQQDLLCLLPVISSVCCFLMLVGIVLVFTIKRKKFKMFVQRCTDRPGQHWAPDSRPTAEELQGLQIVSKEQN